MLRQCLFAAVLFFFSLSCYGRAIAPLNEAIHAIIEGKKATVAVSIARSGAPPLLSIHGDVPLPMQSVFKFHLAAAVLHQVDLGMLSLSDNITITADDVDNTLWSPIRKKYPDGTVLTLAEIIQFTVASSDNVGCDVLFRLLGGPKAVEAYLHQVGITDIAIQHNESQMQRVWERQYQNWTTANAANQALRAFYENSAPLLSAQSHRFLWDVMKSSWTGKHKIRGGLPEGTVVAHKTGSSGQHSSGLTGAENDIGIIFLPDGSFIYLSIMVSDSHETSQANKQIIADIARVTWRYFTRL